MRQSKPLARKTPIAATSPKAKAAPTRRSAIKPKKLQATAAERRHMGRVQELGCVVCSECLGIAGTPAIVHHLRTGQGAMRASHWHTMPLCSHHHQHSGAGVHDMGRPQFAALYGKSEVELLVIVLIRLGELEAHPVCVGDYSMLE